MSDFERRIRQASTKQAELRETLSQTKYAAATLDVKLLALIDLDSEIKFNNVKIRRLESRGASHVKERDSRVRRFVKPATRSKSEEDEAARQTTEYYQGLRHLQEISALNMELKQQRREDRLARDQLVAAKKQHEHTQRALDTLLNDIFDKDRSASSRCPGPVESRLMEAIKVAQEEHDAVKLRHNETVHGVSLMVQAGKLADQAVDAMQKAREASRMYMMNGAIAVDLAERQRLAEAEAAYVKVVDLARRADVGSLPTVRMNRNRGSMVGVMVVHDEMKRTQQEMIKMRSAVRSRLKVVQDRLNAIQPELDDAEKQLEAAARELLTERESIFAQVAKVGNQAPPPYEA